MNAALQADIEQLKPWFHNLHINGNQTYANHYLGDFPNFKWQEIAPHLPADLSGKTVLDIGCNAGFYTFELAKRGAQVTAIDLDQHYLKQARWAAKELRLEHQVEFRQQQVYDLAKSNEQYDIVWFMGVLYHLRYPLLALDIVAEKVKELLVFQTLTMPGEGELQVDDNYSLNDRADMLKEDFPRMAFIERNLNNDPTNWWAPNHAGICAMLRTSGLQVRQQVGHELYFCTPTGQPGVQQHWNRSEYLSARGENWVEEAKDKTGK